MTGVWLRSSRDLLETHPKADAGNNSGLNIHETRARGIERLFERRIDDLQISGGAEPTRDSHVVVRLERVFALQSKIQVFSQEGNERAAELRSRKCKSEVIVRAARHAFAADSYEESVLDGVRVAI